MKNRILVEKTYIRFGRIPESGRSFNFKEKIHEKGVSVYEAIVDKNGYQILLPRLDSSTVVTLGICFNLSQGLSSFIRRPVYEVDGEIIGIGSDGEVLLKNPRIIKRLYVEEFFKRKLW